MKKCIEINALGKLSFLLLLFVVTPVFAQEGDIESLRKSSKAFSSIARSVSPSVVFIQVTKKGTGSLSTPFGDDLFKRFFDERFHGFPLPKAPDQPHKYQGQGSGFVFAVKESLFSDKSYILTNNHVVENAENIKITLKDKREFDAKIVGTDPQSDVAILEIKVNKLPALVIGDSSKLEVGEWVVAIGNPFGLNHTLTVGVVSAKGRTSLGINDYEDFIQTDAAINPGNSGGPLLNLNGEVVGVNTAIFTKSGGYMGIGFAVPINLVNSIAQQLIAHGEVTRGHLGIIIQDLSPALAQSFNLDQQIGVLISQVMEDSPAKNAGLQQGDVIVSYKGEAVTSVGHFRNLVALTNPESKAKLNVIREGESIDITVKIGQKPEGEQQEKTTGQSSEELGLRVKTITQKLAKQYGIKAGYGVLVTTIKPGSIAAMAGIRAGSVILQINHQTVKSAGQFRRLLSKSSKNKSILLLLQEDNQQRYLVLNW